MSDLFKISIIKKEETIVTLKVTIIHPDQKSFYWDTRFIIDIFEKPSLIIDDNSRKKPKGLLGHYYSPYRNIMLLPEKVSGIFKSYTIISTENYPFPKGINFNKEWDNLLNNDKLPYAIYQVIFTEPKWIEHLVIGDAWTTSAFGYDPYPAKEIQENTFLF